MLHRLALIIFAVTAFLAFAPTHVGGQVSYVMVTGNSMKPLMKSGSLALVRTSPQYKVGDVVAYRYPRLGVVIHRIQSREGDTFTLKGDNNDWLDGHHPRASEILGKMWFHAEGLGKPAKTLQSPRNAAMLVGVVGTAMAVTSEETGKRKQRKGGRRRPEPSQRKQQLKAIGGPAIETALLIAVVASLAFGLLALFAYRHPTQVMKNKLTSYEQQANFRYSADVPPGIYDSTSVQNGDPVFRKLTSKLAVEMDYALSSEATVQVTGAYRMVARIEHPANGWKRTFELLGSTPFTGPKFTASGTLDLGTIQNAISTLESTAELQGAQNYQLSVVTEITVNGTLGDTPIEQTYNPRLDFTLDPISLVLESGQEGDDPTSDTTAESSLRQRLEDNDVSVFGFESKVPMLRVGALGGLGLSALAALIAWAMISRAGADPAGKIAVEHRRLLVEIQGGKLSVEEGPRVEVAGIDDLAKVAEQEGRMILHDQGERGHRYFVLSDDAIYYYRLPLDGVVPVAESNEQA